MRRECRGRWSRSRSWSPVSPGSAARPGLRGRAVAAAGRRYNDIALRAEHYHTVGQGSAARGVPYRSSAAGRPGSHPPPAHNERCSGNRPGMNINQSASIGSPQQRRGRDERERALNAPPAPFGVHRLAAPVADWKDFFPTVGEAISSPKRVLDFRDNPVVTVNSSGTGIRTLCLIMTRLVVYRDLGVGLRYHSDFMTRTTPRFIRL